MFSVQKITKKSNLSEILYLDFYCMNLPMIYSTKYKKIQGLLKIIRQH